ncbi:hypothetical protein FOL47_001259, partial [Perkinsus chesapeaki]
LDRAGTVDANKDIIQLATVWKAKRPHLFVGIDLAGNPIKGDARDFMPLLERARGHGLKITTHIAELPDKDDETDAILKFKPDRLGHALWLRAIDMAFCDENTKTRLRDKIHKSLLGK